MATPLSGPGVGLPLPQYLYPSELFGAPNDQSSNYIDLNAGDTLVIPAGNWYITPGPYTIIQYLDPVTGVWRAHSSALDKIKYIKSDGFTFRLANLTGCPVAAVVTNAGNGSYVQATTTCVPTTGNSTWYPIVGGMVSSTTIANAGAGYGMAPILLIPAPPSPGVPATAHATYSGGSVTAVTFTNWGAGYQTAPVCTVIPNPNDPNFLAGTAITPATITLGLFGTGSIAAVLCTNSGISLSAAPTLTIAGAGASATATALRMATITAGTAQGGGTGWTGGAGVTTVGGGSGATNVNTNPAIELTSYIPRQANILLAATSGTLVSVSTIYDGGLFLTAPSVLVSPLVGAIPTTAASITLTLGGVADVSQIQPGP